MGVIGFLIAQCEMRVPPLARRAVLVQALSLSAVSWPFRATASFPDRLRARYILLRPGETTFEAARMVDSNPINKQQTERGLTSRGILQVERSVKELKDVRNIMSPQIFYDNGVRASQTAEIVSKGLSVPRRDVEPEFRWLEARGLGALDGTDLRTATLKLRALDALDIDNAAEPTDDGTPADSVNEVYSRLRNTISKIENTYGGGDFVIIGGDATVLSVFAAAACGVDLREHSRFELPPGDYWDLRELVRDWKAGTFEPKVVSLPSEMEARQGRAALNDMGASRLFAESAAGSCLCCSCSR